MTDILINYEKVPPITWVYLSSLLTIGLFFKFGRFWSVRNLDLLLLILVAPGLILEAHSSYEPAGYIWLFIIGAVFLVRLLADSGLVRRPLLEPNMNVGGMTFLGLSLLLFLMANVAASQRADFEPTISQFANQASGNVAVSETGLEQHGPRNPLLVYLPSILTQNLYPDDVDDSYSVRVDKISTRSIHMAKVLAIFSHLAIVVGMVMIGYLHFDNVTTGIAAAVLYLLLPYMALMTGRVDHCLPAALVVWAVVTYRVPLMAGMFLGLAFGVIYYPLFLLPLWISFYWERGLLRFVVGGLVMIAVSVFVTALASENLLDDLTQMFGVALPIMTTEGFEGFWRIQQIDPGYRIPVLVLFVAMAGSFVVWPVQKNLGTLISGSAAVMLGTQFWHAHGGGLFMAWYLPLLLLTIFRPNLEDRIAVSVLGFRWLPRLRRPAAGSEKSG